ncbi:Bifunctional (S)-malyl-CoA lyase/thioesterase [Haloferax volcanii]|nr:Bifunctional (S)-malyl-CoA lyase/thioesterase [Haloferax alexandrinus]
MRTFFTSPTAVEGEDDSAKMLRRAAGLRGMQAPDVWVPDNEDATAPSMRDEGAENIVEVISEHGSEFPGEIHPRMVWHRDSPETRYQGFQHMLDITDPERGAVEHIDGFVIPEVGGIDDWKKADECFTIVEHEHGLDERSLAMSVIIESGEAELAMGDLRDEMGKPSNNLERLFLLVDGEVDYTKDMRAMTPTGELPAWPELRHNTSRGASAAGCIAVDGPYDDIRDVEGYRERMTDNQAKGMLGIWSLTPGQVVEANTSPLPPKTGSWLLDADGEEVELASEDGVEAYDGDRLSLEATDGGYELRVGGDARELTADELREELLGLTSYVPSMDDIVDSMKEFEAAKEAGRGAIAMTQSATLRIGGTEIDIEKDRMWDEATYQAAMTPISLFQDVYENRPDQHDELEERYGAGVVERAMEVGL